MRADHLFSLEVFHIHPLRGLSSALYDIHIISVRVASGVFLHVHSQAFPGTKSRSRALHLVVLPPGGVDCELFALRCGRSGHDTHRPQPHRLFGSGPELSAMIVLSTCRHYFRDAWLDVLHAQLGQPWSGSDKSRIKYSY